MILDKVASGLFKSGMAVLFAGVLGPLLIGWIQIFAIVAFGLPENPDQLAWVFRVMAVAVLFALVTIPVGFGVAVLDAHIASQKGKK